MENISKNIKFKKLENKDILISIERLTRFKMPGEKYMRVFKDIILHYLIQPKFNSKTLETLKAEEITEIAEYIINNSLKTNSENIEINHILKKVAESMYNLEKDEKIYLKNKIDYYSAIKLIKSQKEKNLRWLKYLKLNLKIKKDIEELRKEKKLKFPIKKILLVEGATEEILLPIFAKKSLFDFDEYGIHLIATGGKNQVARTYFNLVEKIKLPIRILLDSDAIEVKKRIEKKLRKKDKIIIIKDGEFEDILPLNLIKRALNNTHQNEYKVVKKELKSQEKMTTILQEVFKNKGWGEFKKVKFAKAVFENIKSTKDISAELLKILKEIKS